MSKAHVVNVATKAGRHQASCNCGWRGQRADKQTAEAEGQRHVLFAAVWTSGAASQS